MLVSRVRVSSRAAGELLKSPMDLRMKDVLEIKNFSRASKSLSGKA
jgi:hypothetical protein